MITLEQVRKKAMNNYIAFLQSWLCGAQFFPYSLPIGKVPDTFATFQEAVQTLHSQSKAYCGFGYDIISQTKRMKHWGVQNVPLQIVWRSADEFLAFLGKREEFQRFQNNSLLIRQRLPQLETWLMQNPSHILTYDKDWPALLLICTYFMEHPRPGCSMRELPLPISTKFLEKRTRIVEELLKQVLPPDAMDLEEVTFEKRFGLAEKDAEMHLRFLDEQLQTACQVRFASFGTGLSELIRLDIQGCVCLIVENKDTFLALPSLPNTLAIWGSGKMVTVLKQLPWLRTCILLYWGDLDAQGFEILSQLRQTYPKTRSLMMDEKTFCAFTSAVIEGTPCAGKPLPCLTQEEHALYTYLAQTNKRLEQEHVPRVYSQSQLQEYFQ